MAGLWGSAGLKAEAVLHFLTAAARQLDLDCLVLVEVFDSDLLHSIERQLGPALGWDWAHHPRASGVMVGLRGRIDRAVALDLRCGGGGCCQFDCLVNKGALHCAGRPSRAGAPPLDLVGLHLQSYDTCGARPRQLERLRRYLDRLPRPAYLAGDFNVVVFSGGAVFGEFEALRGTLRAAAPRLSRTPLEYSARSRRLRLGRRAGRLGDLHSYPLRFGTGPGLIDYVLGCNGAPAARCQLVRHPGGRGASDHHAILARLTPPRTPSASSAGAAACRPATRGSTRAKDSVPV